MATKKAATKRSIAKKTPVKKSAANAAPKKSAPAKATGKMALAKTASGRKTGAKGKDEANYTKPELREKIKAEVMAGDKGGRPGQWSARKAQLVAHEYVAEGGEYKHPRNEAQEHLKEWGDEHWHTDDGKPAIEGETTHRYLPDKAWQELSPEERKATDEKKVRGSRKGKQFVPNTEKAKAARKHATK